MNKSNIKDVEDVKEIEADFIISIGESCRPGFHLNRHNLRKVSNPLDWMMCYSLNTAADLFKTRFETFFKSCKEYTDKKREIHRYVQDISNGMIAMHSFQADLNFEEAKNKFHIIMAKRYERMHNYMENSKHILFVSNRIDPVEDFENFLIEIYKIYNKKLTVLNIRNSFKREKIINKISNDLTFIEYSFNDVHPKGIDPIISPHGWVGNVKEWDELMKKVKLSNLLFEETNINPDIENLEQNLF